jgi:hypothetical protein
VWCACRGDGWLRISVPIPSVRTLFSNDVRTGHDVLCLPKGLVPSADAAGSACQHHHVTQRGTPRNNHIEMCFKY